MAESELLELVLDRNQQLGYPDENFFPPIFISFHHMFY